MKSIKANIVYNLINVVSGMVFPLIAFPYASRILLADGIGQVGFFSSIISYVSLFCSLGIPIYGVKLIAGLRDDKEAVSKATIELIILSLLLGLAGYLCVGIISVTVAEVKVNVPLFLVLSLSIVLSAIGCSWFYAGTEDFKYITIVGLLIKVLSILYLFLFVHTKQDLLSYGIYSIVCTSGSNLINFARLHKLIDFKSVKLKSLNIAQHIAPAFKIFILNLLTSIYLNLDSVMLGFISGESSVGYYQTATKISHIFILLITSLGTVLLPRMSNYANNGNESAFRELASKSYQCILMFSIPISIGLYLLAPSLVCLFAGDSFQPSIFTLQLLAPLSIVIGFSNFIGIQVLYPIGKISLVSISTAVGALVNFTLNAMLIKTYAQNGAAFASLTAEISVAAVQLVIGRKYIPIKIFNPKYIRYLIASFIMFVLCYHISGMCSTDTSRIFIVSFSGAIIYGLLLLLFKDSLLVEYSDMLWKRIKSK